MSRRISIPSPRANENREKKRSQSLLFNVCVVIFIAESIYCALTPWFLGPITHHLELTIGVTSIGLVMSLIGMYCVKRVDEHLIIRLLSLGVVFTYCAQVLAAPETALYIFPFTIGCLFITFTTMRSQDLWFGVTCSLLSLFIPLFYLWLINYKPSPLIWSSIGLNAALMIGISTTITIILSLDLRGRIQDLMSAQRLVVAEQMRVERASLAKSTFLAHLGHELRAPLQRITNDTMHLSHDLKVIDESHQYLDEFGDDLRADLERIQEASTLLAQLIDDLSHLSQIESEGVRLHVTALVAESCINQLKEAIEDRGLPTFLKVESHFPTDHILFLDHERTLKLFCLVCAHIYQLSAHIQLDLEATLTSNGELCLYVFDSPIEDFNLTKGSEGYLEMNVKKDLLNIKSLPLIEAPTLSLPRAQPALVLGTRIASSLNAQLSFGAKRDDDRRGRFCLILPQLELRTRGSSLIG